MKIHPGANIPRYRKIGVTTDRGTNKPRYRHIEVSINQGINKPRLQRSQEVIDRILGTDRKKKVEKDFEAAKQYTFSSFAQLKAVMSSGVIG